MSTRRLVASGLASAMLAGSWTRRRMLFRCSESVGSSGMWLRSLIDAVLSQWKVRPADGFEPVRNFILDRRELSEFRQRRRGSTGVLHWHFYPSPPPMSPRWSVKRLESLGDVCSWLGLTESDLGWLADRKGLERTARDPRMQNYSYRWVPKASGGNRLIEAPKQRLREIQRRLLHDVLDEIPPHPAAHGFRRGRSPLTHARLHAGNETVIRFDPRAFFSEVPTARAFGIFVTAGYPRQVARTLIALCTNQTPPEVVRDAPFELRSLLTHPHLPQGAPTSPALANLVAFSLDVRLTALGERFGARYSRYADDLVFSGARTLGVGNLARAVNEVVLDEGFTLNPLKTRVMTAGRRQSVTGAVVNQGVNVPRDAYDALKATLHNCVKHGLESQARGVENFRAHLAGKVAWVEQLNPARGAKLRALLSQIPA